MVFIIVCVKQGCKTLKDWSGINIDGGQTFADVFCGNVESLSLDTLTISTVRVGKCKNDLIPVTADLRVEEVTSTLGCFVEYVCASPPPTSTAADTRACAFQILMSAPAKTCLPKKVVERDSLSRMKNDIVDWLEKNSLGWSKQYVGYHRERKN